jgi:glycosyltransferase involved in cell wall biosynthesis
MTGVEVTVVVCTYNRAGPLREALASLHQQQAPAGLRYEIVVVDNASTDATPAVIAEATHQSPVPLRGVREPRAGVACARNRGVREAQGRWVAFFDDDQVADPHWLAELLDTARQKQARCVGGANRLRLPDDREDDLPQTCRSLLGAAAYPPAPCRYSRRWAPGAGNLLVERSLFDEIGYFDEALREAGEDADLFRRMYAAGVEAWLTPRAVSYHVIAAYRLEDAYLRWKSLRHGGHIARRNRREWGRVMFVLILLARLSQAGVVLLPRLGWSLLRGDLDSVLAARCRLWRSEGYIRFALHFLAPRLFAQRSFFGRLEFRAERELFAAAATGEVAQ